MYANQQWVDEDVMPLSREELEARHTQFLEEDAGNFRCIPGRSASHGPVLIYENGAIWSKTHGRVRGPLREGSTEYLKHRHRFIQGMKYDLEQTKVEYSTRHDKLVKQLKQCYVSGQEPSEEITNEIEEVKRLKKAISNKTSRLYRVTAPEREQEAADRRVHEVSKQMQFDLVQESNDYVKSFDLDPVVIPRLTIATRSEPYDGPTELHVTQFDE